MGLRPMLVYGAPLALLRRRRVLRPAVSARLRSGQALEACPFDLATASIEGRSARLCVLGEFEEGVFGGAARHFVEGGAGGDHGVDAVFLFDLEVDEERFAAGAGARYGRSYF